ncbi:MAG: nuclear transport factor 2 family protein [Spirosomataceae bacterium]
MKSNIETIAQLYADFGQGNIPAILEQLSDDVKWEFPASVNNVPFSGIFEGKAGVIDFFQNVGATNDFHEFNVEKLLADNDTVVALGNLKATAKTTGKISANSWAHRWDFKDGKVVSHYEYVDSAEITKAFS